MCLVIVATVPPAGMTSDGAVVRCLAEVTLVALAEGALRGRERGVALRHVEGCAECAELLGQAARLTSRERYVRGRYLVHHQWCARARQLVLAYDVAMRQEVVLLRAETGHGRPHRELCRGARALASLEHPGLAALVQVEVERTEVLVARRRPAGVALPTWLRQRSRTNEEVVGALLPAGEMLCAAHAVGMVHAAFEARSVMVGAPRPGAAAWIIDLGLDGLLSGAPGAAPADAHRDVRAFCLVVLDALVGAPVSRVLVASMSRGHHHASLWRRVPAGPGAALRAALDPARRRSAGMAELLAALRVTIPIASSLQGRE